MSKIKALPTAGPEEVALAWEGHGELRAVVSGFSPEIRARLAAHGLEQKLRDAAAGKDAASGFKAAQEVLQSLLAGQWARSREKGGSSAAPVLARAIAKVKNLPLDLVVERLKGLSASQRSDLARVPAIVRAMAEIRAEKAPANADALLALVEEGPTKVPTEGPTKAPPVETPAKTPPPTAKAARRK